MEIQEIVHAGSGSTNSVAMMMRMFFTVFDRPFFRFFKRHLWLWAILFAVQQRAAAQQCPTLGSTYTLGEQYYAPCASSPALTHLNGTYTLDFSDCSSVSKEVYIDVDWGDGSPMETFTAYVRSQPAPQDNPNLYQYDFSLPHYFAPGEDACEYTMIAYIRLRTQPHSVLNYHFSASHSAYHQTDDYGGARKMVFRNMLTQTDTLLVCEGVDLKVRFQDMTPLNCNPLEKTAYKQNESTRYLQIGYGVDENFNAANSNIPNIKVNGVFVTDAAGVSTPRYNGGNGYTNVAVFPNHKGPTTGHQSSEVEIDGASTLGKAGTLFHVTLYNWNKCNELGNTSNPTAADRGYAIRRHAVIKIVKTPPPPQNADIVFCYNLNGTKYSDADYKVTLTHDPTPMLNGTYYWFKDNGSGAPNFADTIYTTTSKDFNPRTNPTSGKLNPPTTSGGQGSSTAYWVTYQFRQTGGGGTSALCSSDPAKITFTFRRDIWSAPAAKPNMEYCSGDTIVLSYPAESYTYGGAVEFVWTLPNTTNYRFVGVSGTTATGNSVKIQVINNAGPAVVNGSVLNVPVKVYRRWATNVTVLPAGCAATDCNRCPSEVRNIYPRIYALPTATLSGGGEICATENISLIISNFRGATGYSTNFEVTLKGVSGAPLLSNGTNNLSFPVNPEAGKRTRYSINTLKDVTTGCVNKNFTAEVAITKRAAIVLTSLTGADLVCAGSTVPYTVSPAATDIPVVDAVTSAQVATNPTTYVWNYNGNPVVNATNKLSPYNLSVGSAADNYTEAVRKLTVTRRYTTLTSPPLGQNLTANYCPVTLPAKNITVIPAPSAKVSGNTSFAVCDDPGSNVNVSVALEGWKGTSPGKDWALTWTVTGPSGTYGGSSAAPVTAASSTGKKTVTINVPHAAIDQPGQYTFTITGVTQPNTGAATICTGNVQTPSTVTIRVLKNPGAVLEAMPTGLCEGMDTQFGVTVSGDALATSFTLVYQSNETGVVQTVTVTLSGTGSQPVAVPWSGLSHPNPTHIKLVSITQNVPAAYPQCAVALTGQEDDIAYSVNDVANAGPDLDLCMAPPYGTVLQAVATQSGYEGTWAMHSVPSGASISFANNHNHNTNATGTMVGRYELVWTVHDQSATCPDTRDTVLVTWGTAVPAPNAGGNIALCYDNTSEASRLAGAHQLQGTNPNTSLYTGVWNKISGPGNATFVDPANGQSKVYVDQGGEYTFEWTLSSGGCTPQSANVLVYFSENPAMNTLATQNYCPGQLTTAPTFSINQAFPVDYTWAFNPASKYLSGYAASGAGQFPAGITAPDNTSSVNDVYQVIATASTKAANASWGQAIPVCTGSQAFTINLKPRPVIKPIDNANACAGQTVTFGMSNLNQAVTYTWTNSAPAIGLSASGSAPVSSSPYTYSFVTTNATNPGTDLTATISVTAAITGGCTGTLDTVLTVRPVPAIAISPSSLVLCPLEDVEPSHITFSTSNNVAGTSFAWVYDPLAPAIGVPSSGNGTNLGTFTVNENQSTIALQGKVTVTAAFNSCSSTRDVTVILNPRPKMTTPAAQALCPDPDGTGGTFSNITFATSPVLTGVTYGWRVAPPAVTPPVPTTPASGAGTFTNVDFPDNISGADRAYRLYVAGNYTLNGKTCTSDSAYATLTVRQRPVITISPAGQSICPGLDFASTTFTDNANQTSTFRWMQSAPGVVGLSDASGTGSIGSFTAPANITTADLVSSLKAYATSPYGCVGDTTTVVWKVLRQPNVTKPVDIADCPEMSLGATAFASNIAAGTPGLSYNWHISSTTPRVTNLPASQTNVQGLPAFATLGNVTGATRTETVTVEGMYLTCASGTKTFTISVKPKPVITFPTANLSVCPDDTVTFFSSNTNIPPYNQSASIGWKMNNKNVVANPATYSPSGTGNIPGFDAVNNLTGANLVSNFAVAATIDGCAGDSVRFTVTVKPRPDISFVSGSGPFYYCDGNSVQLPPFASSFESSGATYRWSKDNTNIGPIQTAYTANPIPSFEAVNSSINKQSDITSHFAANSYLNSCPSDTMHFDVVVRAVPQLVYRDTAICAGTELTPAAFGTRPAAGTGDVANFEWTVINGWFLESGLPNTTQTGSIPQFVADTSGHTPELWGTTPQRLTIQVTTTLNGCPAMAATNMYITINPLPKTEIASNSDRCIDNGIQLVYNISTPSPGSNYTWGTDGPALGMPAPEAALQGKSYMLYLFPSTAVPWNGAITATETNVFGCTAPRARLNLDVIPAPRVSLDPSANICFGDTLHPVATLLSGNPATVQYNWFPANYVVIDNTERTNSPTVKPAQNTFNLIVSAEEAGCRSKNDTMVVNVYRQPDPLMIYNADYCTSSTEMIMGVKGQEAGHTIHWERVVGSIPPYSYPAITGTDFVGNDTIDMRNTVAYSNALPSRAQPPSFLFAQSMPDTIVKYRVYQTSTLGCVSPIVEAQMKIRRSPNAPTPITAEYCEDGQTSFVLNAHATNTRWYSSTNKADYLRTADMLYAQPAFTPPLTAQTSFTYYISSTDPSGCESELVTATLTVNPNPVADFAHDVLGAICPPNPVTFTNTPVTDVVYTWNYGDGTIINDNTGSVQHVYTNTTGRLYDIFVELKAVNEYACVSTQMQRLTIAPQVKADFTYETEGCSPFLVQFVSQSIGATTYSWNFGPHTSPTTGSEFAPMRTFINSTMLPATETITMIASNNWCSHSATKTITVYPQPNAAFTTNGTIQGCQPLPVTFTNLSQNGSQIMKYILDFGDASVDSSGQININHSYTNLQAVSDVVHPVLTARNQWGCTNRASTTVTIFPFIKADFLMLGDSVGCPPLNVSFLNGSRGYDSDQMEWSFGDGSISSELNPVHTFMPVVPSDMSGDVQYTVKLVVRQGGQMACADSSIRVITALHQPRADFTVAPYQQSYPNSTIALNNQIPASVRDGFSYDWSAIEQGSAGTVLPIQMSTMPNPGGYTFGRWGRFKILQTVSAAKCQDTISRMVVISAPFPVADFEDVPPSCLPYEVHFNNLSLNGNSYQWIFGDGSPNSSDKNPVHKYQDAGTYTVILTVYGDAGVTSINKDIVVYPMPRASFEVKPDFLWVGQPLRAFNQTSSITSSGQPFDVWYLWQWGDGSTDTTHSPSHIYRKEGEYDISLTVGTRTSPACTDSMMIAGAVTLETAGDIIMPNTFKPDAMGPSEGNINPSGYQNHLFYPPVLTPTSRYHFVIYNRWGQLIFETKDPTKGWDGYFKGALCEEGVYMYKIEGVFITGQSFSTVGDVLLLR